jgi:formate dehydrogenase iron-sulfur subunit
MTNFATGSDLLNLDGGPKPGTEGVRFGFFTDTSICIGCKACEVACKEWNEVPENRTGFTGHSMDNTGALGANAWRHVAFIEQPHHPGLRSSSPQGGGAVGPRSSSPQGGSAVGPRSSSPQGGSAVGLEWFGDDVATQGTPDFRWLMSSDVCKHCTEAACLEVCPTGAIFYTEFRTVVVQDDVCNGCGYCVTACPFGVIERRESDGGAHKCTLCYDRLRDNRQPACSQACPTDSIKFGPLDELRAYADERVGDLVAAGQPAQLYGHDSTDGVGGTGAFFLLLDDPEVYRLPPDPVTPTRNAKALWAAAARTAGVLAVAIAAAVVGGRSR